MVAILAIFSTFWPFSPHFFPFTPIFPTPTVSGKVPILLYAQIWFIRASEWPSESDIAAKLPDWWPIWQFFLLFGHFPPFFPKVCHFLIFFGIIHYIQYFSQGFRQKIRKKFFFFSYPISADQSFAHFNWFFKLHFFHIRFQLLNLICKKTHSIGVWFRNIQMTNSLSRCKTISSRQEKQSRK